MITTHQNFKQGCKQPILQAAYQQHTQQCPFQRIKCQSPGCYVTTLLKCQQSHLANCEYVQVICQNCSKLFNRKTIQYHQVQNRSIIEDACQPKQINDSKIDKKQNTKQNDNHYDDSEEKRNEIYDELDWLKDQLANLTDLFQAEKLEQSKKEQVPDFKSIYQSFAKIIETQQEQIDKLKEELKLLRISQGQINI